MIYLFTGTPGAGKTLNAIDFVLTDSRFNVKVPDPQDPKKMIDKIVDGLPVKRDVYYFNISEVQHPWHELTEEQVKTWFDLPSGAVIFIDECQDVFTGVQRNNALPPLYSRLNKHRHQGQDLILVTQGGSLLTTCIRPLVNHHFHLENEDGGESCKWVTKGAFIDNPTRKAIRSTCEVNSKGYPKHLYGTYKSADVHTKKYKFPPVLRRLIIMLVLLTFVLGGGGYYFYSRVSDSIVESEKLTNKDGSVTRSSVGFSEDKANYAKSDSDFKAVLPMDPVEYLKIVTPRIQGIAHTAPLFDSFISSPKSSPKTICYGQRRGGKYICKCVTEQMTALDTPHNTCVSIVNNGLYDVTISTTDS